MRDNEKPPGRELGGFGTIRPIDFREGFRFTVPPERASVAAVWLSLAILRRLWPAAHVHETIDQPHARNKPIIVRTLAWSRHYCGTSSRRFPVNVSWRTGQRRGQTTSFPLPPQQG